MARFLKKKTASLGQAPGELVFIGEQKVEETTIRVIDYDQIFQTPKLALTTYKKVTP